MRIALALAALLAFPALSARADEAGLAKAARSSGIAITALKATGRGTAIDIRFTLTNETKATVYLRDARTEPTQAASLSSGSRLYPPSVVGGISDDCGTLQNCLHQPTAREISAYSPVEPGGTLPFNFHYQSGTPLTGEASMSFSVALLAMFAQPGSDPSKPGALQSLRFSFVDLPIAH